MVSAADLGLAVFLLAPTHMALTDKLLGVALWLPAVLFTTIGLVARCTPMLTGNPHYSTDTVTVPPP